MKLHIFRQKIISMLEIISLKSDQLEILLSVYLLFCIINLQYFNMTKSTGINDTYEYTCFLLRQVFLCFLDS